jgi:hypothetical protein
MVRRKVERVHAADPELDILDLVLGGPHSRLCELLVVQVDADDATGRTGETERNRPLSAADIENDGVVVQIRKEKIGVVGGVPVLQRLLEVGAHRMIGTVPPSALQAEPVT